mmetsp:Transcript_14934/g.53750  ORF Transcript_14934/g.53750 Transcript_14934/m.53750 type:complete len:241 (-) Transcript_14934:1870-2592(-)
MPTTMKRRARVRTCERANRVRVVASLQLHFFFPGVHSHALPSATAAAAAASAFFFPGFHSHALPAATAPPAPPASFSRCAACVFSASRTPCCNGPYFPLEIVSKNAEGSTSIGRSLSLATTQTKPNGSFASFSHRNWCTSIGAVYATSPTFTGYTRGPSCTTPDPRTPTTACSCSCFSSVVHPPGATSKYRTWNTVDSPRLPKSSYRLHPLNDAPSILYISCGMRSHDQSASFGRWKTLE